MKMKRGKLPKIPLRARRKKKTGLPPGSIVFTGRQKSESTIISGIHYNEKEITDFELDLGHPPLETDGVAWIDIRGLHDVDLMEKIGNAFGIHPLALEDVVDTSQRPKFDEYDNGFFIIVPDFKFNLETRTFEREQVSLYVSEHFLISFQENPNDVFEHLKTRLRASKGRIRHTGTDYLAYALVDSVVDNYFETLDAFQEGMDRIENEIGEDAGSDIKSELHQMKRELLRMRRHTYPLREGINKFARDENPLIKDETRIFLRDAYDHTIQVIEIIDNFRDILSGLQDLYISELSFKMNKVMQVLTLIATIFIPLTFIAGIYGMNFDYMPELKYKYGYFVALGIMFVIGLTLLYLFKRKKWI